MWQEAAVERFLKSLPNGTYAGLFNPRGRVREHCCLSAKENSFTNCFALMHLDRRRLSFSFFCVGDSGRLGASGQLPYLLPRESDER